LGWRVAWLEDENAALREERQRLEAERERLRVENERLQAERERLLDPFGDRLGQRVRVHAGPHRGDRHGQDHAQRMLSVALLPRVGDLGEVLEASHGAGQAPGRRARPGAWRRWAWAMILGQDGASRWGHGVDTVGASTGGRMRGHGRSRLISCCLGVSAWAAWLDGWRWQFILCG
jgi:hypothetical protein